MATSTDGQIWTRSTNGVPLTNTSDGTPTWLNMCRYDDASNQWVGIGDRSILMTSPDGINWTTTFPLGNSTVDFLGICIAPDGWIQVGSRADIRFLPTGSGVWEQKFTGSFTSISDIEYNGSLYVTSGSIIMTSPDGVEWTPRYGGQPGGTLANVVFGNAIWVVASVNNTSQVPLSSSSDGMTWSFNSMSFPAGFTDCVDLALGNGIFVALPQSGTFSLITSTDGINWTGRNDPWFDTRIWRCYLSFGDGKFLAYSLNEATVKIAWSTDGVTWTTHDTGLTGSYYEGAFGNGRWILVGNNGMVATSTDLVNWSEQQIVFGNDGPVRLEGVDFGKDHWVICGRDKSIWSSEDGLTWTPAFKTGYYGSSNLFSETMFDGQTFWTVGGRGDILQSSALNNPAQLSIQKLSPANTMRLTVEGATGDFWNIQTSPDMSEGSWLWMTTIEMSSDVETYDDTTFSGRKFYKLAEPE